jgi:hypothetical protein
MKVVSIIILAGFCLVSFCCGDAVAFTKHFNGSLFKITEKALFSVEILLDEKEYKIGKNVIGVVIHNKDDEDVEGADIVISLRDDQGQTMAASPAIREKGDGLYTVANLELQRKGKWELSIAIKKKKNEDSVTFVFPDVVEKRMPAGKYE